MGDSILPARTQASVSRRTIAQGALWSVPAVAVVAAAPARAASGCDVTSFVAPAPSSTSGDKVVTPWTVPTTVTSIDVTVLGGGGGGYSEGRSGAAGAVVTGSIAVTPGEVLTLVVGAGGVVAAATGGGSNAGGTGFGDGGASGFIPTGNADYFPGGSGGGGSAIVRGATALVIAGGGGGGGRGITAKSYVAETRTRTAERGGAGGTDALNGTVTWTPDPSDPASTWTVTAQGGGGAVNGQAGVGGAESAGGATAPYTELVKTSGDNGQGASLAGSDGGAGSFVTYEGFGDDPFITAGGIASGGGGGGYGGGGGGGTTVTRWFDTTDEIPHDMVIGTASGGGGGGSYTDPSVASVSVKAGSNAGTSVGTRPPGSIIVTYCL